jgi:HK97 family phage prohead protease
MFRLTGRKEPAIFAIRSGPSVRAAASAANRKISILAVPYDGSMSTNLGGFREVYQRGCFDAGLGSDPRVLFNHDESTILGRTSAGTCQLWEDEVGVHADADAPDTTWANDLLVSMRRGDITQASAAFWILQHRWEQRGADRVRIVEKALMREVSVHAFPAYETTVARVSQNDQARAALSRLAKKRHS